MKNYEHMTLTEAEWNVMQCLWNSSPLTGRTLTNVLEHSMGWSRSTTLTLLRRLEEKGAVKSEVRDGVKQFSPLLSQQDAAIQETENLLQRVYRGSLSLMVSTMTQKQAISQTEIEELYRILRQVEKERE